MSESKADMYQVVGECAFLTVEGRPRQLLLKGAVFDGGQVPRRELDHNVEAGLVAKLGGADEAGVNADGGIGASKPLEESEAEQQRAAIRAQLPADGSAPDGRKSDAVQIEWLVTKGYDRAEVEKADRSELRKLVANYKG